MTYYVLVVLGAAAFGALRRFRIRLRPLPFEAALATVLGSLLLTGVLVTRLAERALPGTPSLPVRTIVTATVRAGTYGHLSLALTLALSAIAVGSSYALFSLFARLSTRPASSRERAAVACVSLLMVAASIHMPTIVSSDVYAYVAYARAGSEAYIDPRPADPTLLAVTNAAWGRLDPAPYGPLWIRASTQLFGRTATLDEAVERARVLGVVSLALIVIGCGLLGYGREYIAVILVNPFFAWYFIAEAHNDAPALALAIFALVVVERSRIAALIFGALAGLVKLPYALVAVLAFTKVPKRSDRLAASAILALLTITLGIALGGAHYLAAIVDHVTHNAAPSRLAAIEHAAAATVAVTAIVIALWYARFTAAATFAFPALLAALYPWYLALAMPYALRERRALAAFFCLLPVMGAISDPELDLGITRRVLALGFLVAIYAGSGLGRKTFARFLAFTPALDQHVERRDDKQVQDG